MMNEIFSTIDESSLDQLREWREKYPASSFVACYYAKMLQILHPEEFERTKARHLLHVPDKKKFAAFSLGEGSNLPPTHAPYLFETITTATPEQVNPQIAEEPLPNQAEIITQLIAEFDEETPKIQFDPNKHDGSINYSKASLEEDNEIVSETLARLYEQQGYPKKAVKIYKKLALLFPEKSSYFAALIQELKNL